MATQFLSKVFAYLQQRWMLLLLLVIFIICKWSHLYYPFYWDESWSYAPGVRLMYDHGPAFAPNAIDTFYSRGHPLFFYASSAAWLRLTGYSHFSAHLFALFVSVLLLIAVYEIATRLFNSYAGLLCTLCLAVQVIFFVQASYVLPEVMVALFSLLAVYFFSAGRYLYAGIALTLLLFTKESGIVAGLIIGLGGVVKLIDRNISLKEKISSLLASIIPALLIACFFLLQKKMLGWYLYPEHTGMMKWEWETFYSNWHAALEYLFFKDERRWLLRLVLLLAALAAGFRRQAIYLLPAIPLLIIWADIHGSLGWMPEKLRFIITCAAILICIYTVAYRILKFRTPKGRFVIYSTWFFLLYLVFTAINFFTIRYLIAALVPMIIVYGCTLVWLATSIYPKALPALIVIVFGVGLWGFYKNTGLGDVNLQSYNAMHVQEETVRYLEAQHWYNRTIGFGSFQDQEHLKKPYTGFLHSDTTFTRVSGDIDSTTEVAIFNNIEPDNRRDKIHADSSFQLTHRIASGEAWAEIYTRR